MRSLSLITLVLVYGCSTPQPASLDPCDKWQPLEILNKDSKLERNDKLKRNTYMQGLCDK